jgi:hypothetical protein
MNEAQFPIPGRVGHLPGVPVLAPEKGQDGQCRIRGAMGLKIVLKGYLRLKDCLDEVMRSDVSKTRHGPSFG